MQKQIIENAPFFALRALFGRGVNVIHPAVALVVIIVMDAGSLLCSAARHRR